MTDNTLTPKQLEILVLLYRFRFLTRHHIQLFLNHKNHSLITRWLDDLAQKEMITAFKGTHVTIPTVYCLGKKSIPILKDIDECTSEVLKRVYREPHRSLVFRNHWHFIAELYFHFQKAAKEQQATCHLYTATDLASVSYAPLPLPDAYLTLKEGKKTKRYFLDVFNDNTPMFALKRRIQQYCRYYEGNFWQDHHTQPFPLVLLVCPTPRVLNSLLKFIPHVLESEDTDISFFLSLKDSIQKHGIQADTWTAV